MKFAPKLDSKKIYRYALLLLGAFALLNFVFNLRNIQGFFTKPVFSFPQSVVKKGYFEPSRRNNYLLFNLNDQKEITKLVIATYNSEEKSLTFYDLRTDINVNLAYGFGEDKLSSAFFKGEHAPTPTSIELLRESVSDAFAIPLEGYFYFKNYELNEENLLGLKKKFTGLTNYWKVFWLGKLFGSEMKTDLSLTKVFQVWQKLGDIRADKFGYYSLGDDYYRELESEDKKEVGQKKLYLNKDVFDNLVIQNFNDVPIEREAAKIEMKNGTAHPGLASRAGRMVANLGVEVVAVDNADIDSLDRTLIINYNEKNVTSKRLAYVFDAEIIERPPEEGKRGDIVVVVGNNYYEKIFGK